MNYDRAIQKMWPRIKIGMAREKGKSTSKSNRMEDVKWEALVEGWIKINFDEASKGNPRKSGAGCIIKDHLGETMAFGAVRLPNGTNNEAEFQATLLALKCAKRYGGDKIILEGDSMVVVQVVRNNLISAWHLENLLVCINE
jgi:hypothetical protein